MTNKERKQRELQNAEKRYLNCLKNEDFDGALRIAADYIMKNKLYFIEDLKSELKLTDEEIEGLHFIKTNDPHFSPSGYKKLYLRLEAERIVYSKMPKIHFKGLNQLFQS